MTNEAIGGIMQLTAAATPLVMGALANKDARERADTAAKEANKYGRQLKQLEDNRQDIRNPYANLSVATEAAEFEAQQADASLANTLDTMRAGGFGASGATALARQAAQAKQGIGADIQKQEQANQVKFAEGEKFTFEQQEARELAQLDRAANLQEGYQQREMDALAGQQAIQQQTAGAVTGVLGQVAENPEYLSSLFGGGNSQKYGSEWADIQAGTSGIASKDQFGSYDEFAKWWKKNK